MAALQPQFLGRYNVTTWQGYEYTICYMDNITQGGSSFWQNQNPAHFYLPRLAMQLAVMIFLSHALMFVLKYLHQPRFVAEVTAGIFIGPTYLCSEGALSWLFHVKGMMLLETFADLGLTYYMFLLGLEMDLLAVKHMSKTSLSIGAATILVPLAAGAGLYFVPMHDITGSASSIKPLGAVFWAISLSITSFPDLATILSDFKLLHTDLGTTALTASMISDITAWVLLLVAIVTFEERTFYAAAIPTAIFLAICWFFLRPGIDWMIRQTEKKGGKVNDTHIYFVLAGVATCGSITDACGSHSMVGGFMLGLIFPKGELAMKTMESIEEFVNGIMISAFILLNGFRTNLHDLPSIANLVYAWLVTVAATCVKIIVAVIINLYFGMSSGDGLALGALLNTKGVLALIVLNEGRNLKVLDSVSMTVINFTLWFMTAMVGPILSLTIKKRGHGRQYKQRTVQRSNPDTELRILTCIHSIGNLSGIINLLELSNSTRTSPISVFAIRLVQLLGRASTMLVVHESGKTNSTTIPPTRERAESDQIFNALERYKQIHPTVSVHPLTVVSPYTTMHEDIIQLAEDKHVAMILIPFHKQATVDGGLQIDNHSIREVNQNLLVKSPCTVAMLVDRGLSLFEPSQPSSTHLRVAMLFIGGFDDQEALSYAYRIAGTPGVTLTVVRFLPKENEKSETEKEYDDEFINDFRFQTMMEKYISYHENQLNNCEELVEAIRRKYNEFDLYVVGRGLDVKSPLTVQLSELSDNPELGPIGDALISSAFTQHASVLVVQQPTIEAYRTRPSSRSNGNFRQKKWAFSPVSNPDHGVNENGK